MVVVEEKSSSEPLWEMAGLRKSDSGLPVNLWLDDSKWYTKAGHWKRIKFQGDHGNNVNTGNLYSMTISENPVIMPPDAEIKIKLSSREIEKIKQFVRLNYKLLSDLADAKISFIKFSELMKT
jgi:hypothetical protein